MTEPLTCGVHHVGLAVRDLDEAAGFFVGALGFREVGRNDAYPALFVSDGGVTLTLWRIAQRHGASPRPMSDGEGGHPVGRLPLRNVGVLSAALA